MVAEAYFLKLMTGVILPGSGGKEFKSGGGNIDFRWPISDLVRRVAGFCREGWKAVFIVKNKFCKLRRRCGELLKVPVVDHLIISEESYYSFEEHSLPAEL